MSMQIQNDGTAGIATPLTAPVESAPHSGGSKQVESVANGGSDQVSISSLSGSIAESTAALASQHATRVSELAALYAKGAYQPNSVETARALVSEALAGGSLEEEG
jgi:hypothetical protein